MIIVEKVLFLRDVYLFSGLSTRDLTAIAGSARDVGFAAGTPLFREGDDATSMYVVVQGRLRVEAAGALLTELGPRAVVGEMSLLDGEPRSATVSVIEDSLLLEITADDFEDIVHRYPLSALSLLRIMTRRFRETQNELLALRKEIGRETAASTST